MTRTLLATLLLLVALLTLTGDAAQQPQPGAITGRVVDGFGPLPGATVAVSGENVSRTAVTDRHGDYRFDDLPQGEYRVQVEFAPKFVPKVAGLVVETGRTTLHNVELRLAPGAASTRDYRERSQQGAIAGTVRDTGGGVLPGVTVRVLGPATTRGVTTNSRGEFRFSGLPSGAYRIEATLTGFRREVDSIRVDGGQMASRDVFLRSALWGTKGSIIDYVWPERGVLGALHKADVVAHVRITGQIGTRLLGRDQSFLTTEYAAEVISLVKADVPAVRAGAAIRLLQDAAGEFVEGGQRFVGLNDQYRVGQSLLMFLRREADGTLGQSYGPSFSLVVSEAGLITMPSTPVPGELLPSGLRAEMPVDEAVEALRELLSVPASQVESVRPVVTASERPQPAGAIAGQTTPDVKRSLGVLVGRVVDASGAGLPGVTVTVTVTAGKTGRKVTTDKRGDYRVEDLPPGTYVVSATLPGFRPAEATVRVTLEEIATTRIVLHKAYRGHGEKGGHGGNGGHGEDRRFGCWD